MLSSSILQVEKNAELTTSNELLKEQNELLMREKVIQRRQNEKRENYRFPLCRRLSVHIVFKPLNFNKKSWYINHCNNVWM